MKILLLLALMTASVSQGAATNQNNWHCSRDKFPPHYYPTKEDCEKVCGTAGLSQCSDTILHATG